MTPLVAYYLTGRSTVIARYLSPGQEPTALTSAIELDRPTAIDPDGSRWCDCDPEPHPGSGRPAVLGVPLADYCPRLPGSVGRL